MQKARKLRAFLAQSPDMPEPADWLAGAGGFEPPNVGSKGRCLTTWLRPNQYEMLFNFCSSETLCFSSLTIFGNN